MSFEELLADIDNPTSKKKTDDGGKTRWLGRVKLLATEGQQDQEYTTTVAVWAESRKEFDQMLHTKIASRHLTLLHCEKAMPAVKWLYDYPGDYAALELAKGVFSNWPIAFGSFEKVEKLVDEPAELESYLTITEHDIPPLPEQKGIPFWDKEWIVPELKELLFGQPNPEEILNTYLIVDATLRKEITGFFDLDVLDISVKCLFRGEAAEELKEVAPYLVDMTLPKGAYEDKDKVPMFHKDFFENHWNQGSGILVRSAASMDNTYHHFRKFTKYQDEQGKWYFFRFWEREIFPDYWRNFSSSYQNVARFFCSKNFTQDYELYFIHSVTLTHIKPNIETLKEVNDLVLPFSLSKEDHAFFQSHVDKKFKENVRRQLFERLEKALDTQKKSIDRAIEWAFNFIKAENYGSLIKQNDCYMLSLLIILCNDVASTVMQGPLMSETLIPVSQRIILFKESYIETITTLSEKGE